MQVYRGVRAYHLTTLGDGAVLVDQALTAAGLTFTRTALTVAWPGGRAEGVEFAFVLPGTDQRIGLDLVERLRGAGVWLQIRAVAADAPM